MVQYVKALSFKLNSLNLIQDAQGRRGRPTPKTCPLTSTYGHKHTPQVSVRKIRKEKRNLVRRLCFYVVSVSELVLTAKKPANIFKVSILF